MLLEKNRTEQNNVNCALYAPSDELLIYPGWTPLNGWVDGWMNGQMHGWMVARVSGFGGFFCIIFGGGDSMVALGPTHPVGVLVVAAVLGEGTFCPLSQEDLGANVAMTGGPTAEDGTQRHVTGGDRQGRWGPELLLLPPLSHKNSRKS